MGAPPIVAVVGTSGAGKTTFLEKLIRALKNRNIKVGTIKHHGHDFDMDQPGKDTWRHARAGADAVILSSPAKVALIMKVERELGLGQVAALSGPVDIILAEGYKGAEVPKIEISRKAHSDELISAPQELIALVSDVFRQIGAPCFDLDDADGVADMLIRKFRLKGKHR